MAVKGLKSQAHERVKLKVVGFPVDVYSIKLSHCVSVRYIVKTVHTMPFSTLECALIDVFPNTAKTNTGLGGSSDRLIFLTLCDDNFF